MGQQIPNGAAISIASVMATGLAVTAATNAAACVLTVTNTYAVGDFVEFVSGWSRATNRVFRLSAVAAGSATLEGFDTTSTTLFPIGGGTGTVRKVTTWAQILQILEPAIEGGDIQTGTLQYLENTFETEFATTTSAAGLAFRIGDDIALPGYIAYKAAAITRAQTPLRVVLPNGGILLYAGVANLNENPSLSMNDIMAVAARFSIANQVVRY